MNDCVSGLRIQEQPGYKTIGTRFNICRTALLGTREINLMFTSVAATHFPFQRGAGAHPKTTWRVQNFLNEFIDFRDSDAYASYGHYDLVANATIDVQFLELNMQWSNTSSGIDCRTGLFRTEVLSTTGCALEASSKN